MTGPQLDRNPRKELQKVYEIAKRAIREEKYRQILDSETGEPLGEYRNLDAAFLKVKQHFGLEDP